MKTETLTYENTSPFAVSFARFTPEESDGYKLLILETDHYTEDEIREFRKQGAIVLGYVSLGEVDTNRSYFTELQKQGFLGINPNWNSHYLNLEDAETRRILIDSAAAGVMGKGADGLFLDTIDAVAPYTERKHLKDEMLNLISSLRSEFPDSWIMQNAGLFMVDKTSALIDGLLIEGIATDYNFAAGEYLLRPDEEYNERLNYLRIQIGATGLPVYMVEFAESENMKTGISARLDSLNYPYFISNIGLSSLPDLNDGSFVWEEQK